MVTMEQGRKKSLQCRILTVENKTGILLSSIREEDPKLNSLINHYVRRSHNVYPVYYNDIIDNNTIDSIENFDSDDVQAYFITKYALSEQHNCNEDYEI